MEEAAERVRKGDRTYFETESVAQKLPRLVKAKDGDGRTLLHHAAASGQLELVTLLTEAGAKEVVNEVDEEVGRAC